MALQITTTVKKWDDTCTLSSNLTMNQVKAPEIRDVIQYTEPRMLSTLIVSGAKTPWDTVGNNTKTKIGEIPKDKLIGDYGYRYFIQGRIEKNSEILGQVGSSGASGSFQLRIKDNMLYPGMVVFFYNDKRAARVQSPPTPSTTAGGGFVYTFQTLDGTVFSYNDDVAPQPGVKTCFGSYTIYGEASRRGYSRTFYPDQFINHLTTQRSSLSLSGSALTDVLWVMFNGKKGWMFHKETQNRIRFMMQDERAKWHGRSTMRDANGNLLQVPAMIDEETGNYIWAGDGILPQIEDGNIAYGSGYDGYATIDDHIDMIKTLKKYSNTTYGGQGMRWAVVTGPDGYIRAQEELKQYWRQTFGGVNMVQGSSIADIEVGANFDTFKFAGNSITFVEHPMFGDEQAYSAKGTEGDPLMSGTYIYLDLSKNASSGGSNIEILGKGAYGINRTMVSEYINGLTGYNLKAQSPVDALEFHMLKEDGIFIYNVKSCGIIKRSPF